VTPFEISAFCRLALNMPKFYRTKTWDIVTEKQISADYQYIEII